MEEEVKVTKKEKKSKEKELIEALTLKVKELEDKNLRVTSEMINSNRRKDEECNRLMKYKNEDIILDASDYIDTEYNLISTSPMEKESRKHDSKVKER